MADGERRISRERLLQILDVIRTGIEDGEGLEGVLRWRREGSGFSVEANWRLRGQAEREPRPGLPPNGR